MLRLVSKQSSRKALKQLVSLEAPVANNTTRTFISTNKIERNICNNKLNIFTSSTTLNKNVVFTEILSTSSVAKRFYATPGKQITMPALSPSMTEGNIASWKKKEGDQIKAGDVIAEIETDKATMDFIYEEGNGYLAKILAPEGAKGIEINQPIAIIVSKKEDIEAAKNAKVDSSSSSKPAEAPKQEAPKPASKPAPKPKSTKTYPSHKVVGMPALSPSMETGGIASWAKKVGDQIKAGDVVAQVETDKATMDFVYEEGNGYLAKILVPEGTTGVQINQPVFVIASKKEDCDKFADFTAESNESHEEPAAVESSESSESSTASTTTTSTTTATRAAGERVFASPAARAAAASKGFDVSQITGTGPNNRVIKSDVLEFTPQQKQAEAPATAAAKKPTATAAPSTGTFTDFPHSNIRRVTAARLTESKQTIPHYYLTMECRVDKILKMRQELNAGNTVKLSVNDFIIKAAAAALRDNPVVNSTWTDSYIRRFHNIDINVAVNTDQGLFTPIVRGADMKGLNAISTTVKSLAEKAHQNKLTPSEFESGTFTISNLGMFGIKSFSAVINPPQAAILAVGTTETRVVPGTTPGTQYENATILSVTLSCDHRVVDGALGAEWLKSFKDYMENPLKLLL
ncbi:hypothetical protein DICPUDRAFT_149003 [Dictyostelium purpureum]|uniref:Acetyltransferase component of pyruvate dehydrogenase complex n=1 Tax=Dictyostelium purpureum TaxID=5786 RepID=F0ZCK0_DICPU|nr:uncharacterized protein DICPUDRAFT_149003 [Dictyostelium purpureum]EGC38311.1 hypothetical protein DICPUDRAFT_149003 [Dictyostelium purpureum]|eukprot:XP_003285172.1 hypothetical protein DICPUDRAFT_149003 [Dictyostelium purpureum]